MDGGQPELDLWLRFEVGRAAAQCVLTDGARHLLKPLGAPTILLIAILIRLSVRGTLDK